MQLDQYPNSLCFKCFQLMIQFITKQKYERKLIIYIKNTKKDTIIILSSKFQKEETQQNKNKKIKNQYKINRKRDSKK